MELSKLLYSKKEAAQMLSLSLRSVDYLIANKQLSIRKVGRRVLVPHQSLEVFARRDHVVAVDAVQP